MNTTLAPFVDGVADATQVVMIYGTGSSVSVTVNVQPRPQVPDPKMVSLNDHFGVLARWWHQDTDELSSPSAKAQHPAYALIVQMGRDAIPLILKDLRDNGGDWYRALRALGAEVGDLPAPGATMATTKTAWFQWGARHGFL